MNEISNRNNPAFLSGIVPFLDAWDARHLPRTLRMYLTDQVALRLVNQLGEFGIVVGISHNLATIKALQLAAARWPRLAEPCDPDLNPSAGPHDTFAIILRRENQPVGCAAMRLKRLEGSLSEHIASQSLLAERPDLLPVGQRFRASGFVEKIADVPIAWGSSLWADTNVPKTMVPTLMRLLHLYTFAHWFWSYSVSIAQPRVADHYGLDVHGYEMVTTFARRYSAEGAATDYRILIACRDHVRRMVQHPGYVDLSVDLSSLDLSESHVA
ncbi:MAG: hypothetical protein O9320_18075 [Magnetospirillum sp.]|jgi:hypothetical protein|nr:hypothetical protein [Magnetospirillum sp.]